MVRCASKNGYQRDMRLKEIRLHARNMITILSSIVSIVGWKLYDHLMSTKMLNLMMNKMFICTPIITRKVAKASILDF